MFNDAAIDLSIIVVDTNMWPWEWLLTLSTTGVIEVLRTIVCIGQHRDTPFEVFYSATFSYIPL